jgi:hypothetical protein
MLISPFQLQNRACVRPVRDCAVGVAVAGASMADVIGAGSSSARARARSDAVEAPDLSVSGRLSALACRWWLRRGRARPALQVDTAEAPAARAP